MKMYEAIGRNFKILIFRRGGVFKLDYWENTLKEI